MSRLKLVKKRYCVNCGKEFYSAHKDKKHCSLYCYQKNYYKKNHNNVVRGELKRSERLRWWKTPGLDGITPDEKLKQNFGKIIDFVFGSAA